MSGGEAKGRWRPADNVSALAIMGSATIDLRSAELTGPTIDISAVAIMGGVEVIVPVALFGRIKVGQSAEVYPEAPLGGTWGAKVTVVDRVIDAASGTFGVRLALPNNDLKLPAGLKCRVKFSGVNGGR